MAVQERGPGRAVARGTGGGAGPVGAREARAEADGPGLPGAGRPLRFLRAVPLWRCLGFVLSGTVFGTLTLLALVALTLCSVALSVVGVGLLLAAVTVLLGLPVARVERRRLRLVRAAPPAPVHRWPSSAGPRGLLGERLRERATWRALGHAVVLGVLFSTAGCGLVVCWLLAGALLVTPVIVWALAPETVMILPGQAVPGPWAGLPFSAAGVLGLALCGWLTVVLTSVQIRTAWFLLAPRSDADARRVIELTRSRVRLADAFEAERRRIERDLHDGAQQQLVALTMTLGLARMELGAAAQTPAGELLGRAQGEARRALEQLRQLVRDIHPQVLTDHGLAAAVEEVAQRGPLPVLVDVALPGRLPPLVETTAYFCVTEALANAAKHSGARQVTVRGRLARGRLRLDVVDDGVGGADPGAGSGLTGLADRLAVLGGGLQVSSPPGGPTRLTVEVPCSG